MDITFNPKADKPTVLDSDVIGQYQACINEFEKLGYDDPYLQEIKAEMLKLQQHRIPD